MKIVLMILLGFVFGNGKSFNSQLKTYLNDKLSSYARFEYEIFRMPQSGRLEIDSDKNFRAADGYAYVPVKIFDSKENVSHSVITLRVKLYKNVFVSKQRIDRYESLSPSMFEKKQMNVSRFEGEVVDENALRDSRSKIIINEKSVLLKNMVEPIPLISRGEKVTVHAGDKGVDVSVEGVARQDGLIDQVISVQCRSRIYKAKVIDKYNLSLVE